MATGGPLESISIRGRLLPVAADADVNMSLGGFNNEVEPNGNGTGRIVKSRVPWMLEGVVVEIDDDRADLEFLQEIANGLGTETITVTKADGKVYQGRGTITGEIKRATMNTTAPISLSGPGELTQQ